MADREVEPGVWGSCKCGRTRYNPDTEIWHARTTFECLFNRALHCPWSACGDYCGEGGDVTNLRRVAEKMLVKARAVYAAGAARWNMMVAEEWDEEAIQIQGRENSELWNRRDALRKLLASGCQTCDGTGYVAGAPCPDCQPDAKEADDAEGTG